MNLQLILPVAGSLIGVLISALVAFVVSKRQARNEILKIGMQIDATYRAKLYERRLALYPELAKNLSSLSSAIRAGRVQTAKIREAWEIIREWDGANSIFMSPLSMKAMITLRSHLIELSKSTDEFISNKRARNILLPAIIEMQLALKTELGVMHADGFHKPSHISYLRDAMMDSDNE